MMINVRGAWAAATAVWILVIFFSSTAAAAYWCGLVYEQIAAWVLPAGAHQASGVLRLIADKSVHFVLFFTLALLCWNAVITPPWRRFAIVLGAGLLVGSVSEYLQSFFPGRDPAIRDVLINLSSAGIGGVVNIWRVGRAAYAEGEGNLTSFSSRPRRGLTDTVRSQFRRS